MLKEAAAPHRRLTDHSAHMALDYLIMFIPLLTCSAVYYGFRPVLLVLCGMVSAAVTELVACLLMRRRIRVIDGSALVTGGLIGLMMSPLTPYWVPMVTAVFAIAVVKMPFGGAGRYVFQPAAAGFAFAAVCFDKFGDTPSRIFVYPSPFAGTALPLFSDYGISTAPSMAGMLSAGAAPTSSKMDIVRGSFAGPIGATAAIILLACLLYLFVRRAGSPLITLPYLAVCAAGAALFPRSAGLTRGDSVLFELCAGLLLFVGVFLLNDSVTAPGHWLARICYGTLAGVFVLLLRHFGRFECGECFAVLIVNALSPALDRWCWQLCYSWQHRKGATSHAG